MIERLLVANRGEIARRIFRTCRELGIGTVAVFSDADEHAPHAVEADLAVRLPGSSAADTYLRVDAVVEAALAAGADAVHPGYGFLSEHAGFARAVLEAGLTWVGPPPEAIEAMGSKIAAKKLMAAAGVPVLPELGARDIAERDLPVLVKASAGGGGRGMRVVRELASLAAEVEAASAEAAAAFGDPAVFCEPYLPAGRHIEVQVLADGAGTVWALGERECSIQRRHQKVLEEAPSPLVDEAMRDALGAAAVAAARAVGYLGAGTVEFLADPARPGRFHFLEMNTRLQVEHPVTEAVYGVDLVRLQLEVAAGATLAPLPPPARGHAIEARLYAEDPAQGWRPHTGTVHRFDFPGSPAAAPGTWASQRSQGGTWASQCSSDAVWASHVSPDDGGAALSGGVWASQRSHVDVWASHASPDGGGAALSGGVWASHVSMGQGGGGGVRVDSGVVAGSVVSAHYDAMLAKVVVWAPARDEAARRLAAALAAARIHGVSTNRDLLVRVLRHPAFLAGDTDTSFLERHWADGLAAPLADDRAVELSALAAALAGAQRNRAAAPSWRGLPVGWRNVVSQPQRRSFLAGERTVEVAYRLDRHGRLAEAAVSLSAEPTPSAVDGRAVAGEAQATPAACGGGADLWTSTVEGGGGAGVQLVSSTVDGVVLELGGVRYRFGVAWYGDHDSQAGPAGHGEPLVCVDSPLGPVSLRPAERFPEPGVEVPAGSLLAPMPGAVTAVPVTEGASISKGDVVVVIEAMKMRHPVTAPLDGVVSTIAAAVGDQVAAGAVLAVVTPESVRSQLGRPE
jgi:propionyl-CoA carboxylase alpha chain